MLLHIHVYPSTYPVSQIHLTDLSATHPGELIDERQCYQESTNAHVTGQTTAQFNLETTCSDLPDHVQRKLEERLNKGNELLENDWRR